MTYNAGQIATDVKLLCKMDVIDIGDDDQQNFFIFEQINLFLLEHARTAYLDTWSDVLTVSGDGYATFKLNASDITDLYEPLMVYSVVGGSLKQIRPLKSFDGGAGWFRAGPNSPIYLRGVTGDVKLHYLRYPKKITLATDVPEYPPAGYSGMISWVSAQVKLVKNYYEESQAVRDQADGNAAAQAAQSARGTNQTPIKG